MRGRLMAAALMAVLGLGATTQAATALESIDFNAEGASDSLMETLRASSLLLTAQEAERTAPLDLMAAARAEYGRLIGLLYEQAYFAPTIHVRVDGREAADIAPLSNPTTIDRIVVDIVLGPQFTFGEVSVEPLIAGTVLPEDFATGQPARSTTVRAALTAALDAWRAQGYALAAAADQRVVANHNSNQLNVRLTLTPGPQLRIGTVVPQGQERTRPQRIVDIAGLERGAIHNPEDITDAETRLRQTGAFASVVLNTAETANPDGTVDVTALVQEAPPRRIGFGAEIDSESGGRLSGFWLHRNLLGGAERLRLEAAVDGIAARVGGLGYTLDARYTRPATLNRDTDLELGLNAVRLNERDYEADAFQADATLVRRYSDALRASAGLILRFESADFAGTSRDFGTFGIPVTVTHDTRDVALNATDGHYVWAEAMPYLGFAEAQSGLRLRFDARTYHDLGSEGRFVLAGRAQLGAVIGPDIDATPRGYLFYSGGGGTVRGLPYQSLGVTSGGTDSGGRGFAGLSAELRVRINDTFSVVAFADAGAVSSGVFSGETDWQAGGGAGIRYATPIGPLRLDLAVPIRRNAGVTGNNVQLYLGIGQAF
ncbi:autotransporter assembly complex protein TamA [Pararhodobacter zhoushanensis]|uniref:autotransporter assembly complex protein TamA n=1 Tax=Pararhodobacter zhoushanensis TaxID=2479545 RepID=UPI0013DF1EC7|nr:BamA/TamA family outer membrane protein [Pararhodobacter zhoushanensis]